MSLYVLDTDILTLFQHRNALVRQQVANDAPQDLAIAIITVEEQINGWYAFMRRARRPEEIAKAYNSFTECIRLVGGLQLLSFTEPAVLRFGQLRALKLSVGSNDLRIAAIVLEQNAILVTRNLRDFRLVPGLTTEDWSV